MSIRNNNRKNSQDHGSEKCPFPIIVGDVNSIHVKVGCEFKDSSAIGCHKRVRLCPDIDTFKNCATFIFNRRNSPPRLIAKLLKFGPEYSSDVSGDGPNRDKRDSKDRNEAKNSDSSSESSDTRPPTPPKPRGMSKRNYKNMVRKHRKKYPKRKSPDFKDLQISQKTSLDKRRSDALRIKRAKRGVQDT